MPRKKLPHFRFVAVDLPIEWQETINQAYLKWSIDQAKQGKKPNKTDFVRFVFGSYLNPVRLSPDTNYFYINSIKNNKMVVTYPDGSTKELDLPVF